MKMTNMNMSMKRNTGTRLTLLTILLLSEVLLTPVMSSANTGTSSDSSDNLTAQFLEANKDFDRSFKQLEEKTKDMRELVDLMDKFGLRYELRDYFIQICELQNVDAIEALALMNIESWAGNHEGYNSRSEDRMYYTKGEKCWDEGLFQLTSYSEYRQEQQDKFYNPELIFSLGYVRDSVVFDARDDISNIQVGVAYLGYLYRYYGDYYTASLAYNCGMGTVNRNNTPEVSYEYAHAIKNRWSRREGDI